MKKFFIKAVVLCVLPIATISAIVFLLPIPEHSYSLAIIDKHRILEKTSNQKIVLAGGSNVPFGIDSAAIQNIFHVPVVNFGLHAGFGLGRILDDVSPFLRNGDILLIIPEYQHFTNQWNGNGAAYELIFDARQYRLLRSPHYGLPNNFTGYLATHLKTITARFAPPNPHAHSRYGFNEHGDYVKHLTMENKPFPLQKNIGVINQEYLAYFFQFIDDFAARGITVVISYPSYEEQFFRNSAEVIMELDTVFRAKENMRVISKPENYCFPPELFYDTEYHLNAAGRTLRTTQLITDLQSSGLLQ
jgi:hypothetical protein